jgi:hypothetical protein
MGQLEEIAGTALLFDSEFSSYATGRVLCVAGSLSGIT